MNTHRLIHDSGGDSMRQVGRERRRKGLSNRLRRAAYGLMLVAALPCAHAQEARSESALRKARQLPPLRVQTLAELGQATNLMSLRLYSEVGSNLLRLDLGKKSSGISKGLGLALAMPEMAYLYVNLYCPDDETPGDWSLGSNDSANSPHLLTRREEWALIRGTEQDQLRLILSPQVVVRLDEILGTHGKLEARMQYAPWESLNERSAGTRRVPQAMLSWPFW